MAAEPPTKSSTSVEPNDPATVSVTPDETTARQDGPSRLNLVWVLLCLVPVLTVLLVASFDVVDSVRLETPPADAQRIATRTPMPALWLRRDGVLEQPGEEALAGLVILGGNLATLTNRDVNDNAELRAWWQRSPVSNVDPPPTTLPNDSNVLLRFGDVVATGDLGPGFGPPSFAGSGFTQTLHGAVYSIGGAPLGQGPDDQSLRASLRVSLSAAAALALLKAEATGIRLLSFIINDSPSPVFLSARDAQWLQDAVLEAVRAAIDRTSPYLDELRRVRVVVRSRVSDPTTEPSLPVQQQQPPQQQGPDSKVLPRQETAGTPSSSTAADPSQSVAETSGSGGSSGGFSASSDVTPITHRPSILQYAQEFLASLERAAGTGLPWQQADQVFASGLDPDLAVDGKTSETEIRTQFNPITWTEGRNSYVPALLLWASFVLIIALQIRRRKPGKLPGNNVRGAVIAGALTSGAGLWALGGLEAWWITGLGLGPIDLIEGGVPLLLASGAAASIGLIGGQITFLSAWPHGPRTEAAEETTQEQEALRAVLHRDVPITDASADKLGFDALAEALAKFIDNKSTAPPLVLAVNGPWGAGKSSIMKLLSEKLRTTERFKIAWFNAWKYQKEDQILAAFLSTVAQELSRDLGALFHLKLAMVRLKHASFSQLILLSAPALLIFIAYQAPHWIENFVAFFGPGENDAGLIGTLAAVAGEAVPLVSGAGGIAGLLWIARFFLPFQMHYRRLFARRDVSSQIGFLDQFEREFRLYREAVDHDKFLIVIDDLDRCHPDAVVEVLKTINLIVTSDTGSGKTFFVLGFDPQYVVQSIELHFKDFAAAADLEGGRFGQQYLKKIVTIGVSVPEPAPEALQDLAVSLNAVGNAVGSDSTTATQKAPSWWRRNWLRGLSAAQAVPRPLASFVLFISLVVALAVWDQPATQHPEPGPVADPTPDTVLDLPDTPADARIPDGESPIARDPVVLDLPEPHRGLFDWIALAATALALVGLLSVFYSLWRSAARAQKAPPEPDDSRDFQEALVEHKALLPSNPRDLVRTVNRLRVAHLIQAPPETVPAHYRDPFGGMPLEPQDSVLLNLLQQSRPELFAPRFIEALTREDDGAPSAVKDRLDALAQSDDDLRERARDFTTLAETVTKATGAMFNRAKLVRFLAVNRFVLQRYESKSPASEAVMPEDTATAATPPTIQMPETTPPAEATALDETAPSDDTEDPSKAAE